MLRALMFGLACSLFCLAAQAEGPVKTDEPYARLPLQFGLCDGPSWTGKSLFIPDVKAGILYDYDPVSGMLTKITENVRISGTCYRHGRLYASDNGNARISLLDGHDLTTLAVVDTAEKPVNKPNDLVVDAQGGVYVTLTKPNQVVYVTREGKVSVAVDGLPTPNGLTLSPDEKTLYVASYLPKEIWAYDVTAPGQTANGRKFAFMDDGKDPGADGMTIDADGNVYCAGAKAVWIWNPKGELLGKIETPARPINCKFGDADLKTLYITCFDGLYRQRMTVSGLAPGRDH
ncbi:SMP-30/gluconolactonase/LRE family protein [Planctomicrobium piriforme]|nr:SMP-30/gluconolactonase/LRE family protein [Planctomicrobium piriforme]